MQLLLKLCCALVKLLVVGHLHLVALDPLLGAIVHRGCGPPRPRNPTGGPPGHLLLLLLLLLLVRIGAVLPLCNPLSSGDHLAPLHSRGGLSLTSCSLPDPRFRQGLCPLRWSTVDLVIKLVISALLSFPERLLLTCIAIRLCKIMSGVVLVAKHPPAALFLTPETEPGWSVYSDFEVERRVGSWQVGRPELFGLVGLAPGPTRGMPPGPNGVSGANQARPQVPRGLGRL